MTNQRVYVRSISSSSVEPNILAHISNYQVHVPRSVSPGFQFDGTFRVPTAANGLNNNLLLRNEWFRVGSSTISHDLIRVPGIFSSSGSGSNQYIPRRIHPSHIPILPNTSSFCCNNLNSSNSRYTPFVGASGFHFLRNQQSISSTFVGASRFHFVRNQQSISSTFANSPPVVSNGISTITNIPNPRPALTNPPCTSSNGLNYNIPSKFQPTHFNILPSTSTHSVRSSGSPSVRNQQSTSIFSTSPISVSNGFPAVRDNPLVSPALTSTPGLHLKDSSIFLHNNGQITKIGTNVLNPMGNQVGNLIPKPESDLGGSFVNRRAFNQYTFPIGKVSSCAPHASSGEYKVCRECGFMKKVLSSQQKSNVSQTDSVIVSPRLRDGSGPSIPNVRTAVKAEKTEAFYCPNETREMLTSPLASDAKIEQFYTLGDIVKSCSMFSRKRSGEEISLSNDPMDKGLLPPHKILKKGTSSLDEVEKKGKSLLRNALQQ